ncbi:MAG: hypothetical protein ACETVN_03895 [Asgard group archaeon]
MKDNDDNDNKTVSTHLNMEGKGGGMIPLILLRTCSDCFYFLYYDRLCALCYWLLKTHYENYIPQECQGRKERISPKLNGCRNFRQKQTKPEEIRLETLSELSTIPPKKAVICHICNKKLAKTPTLKTPAKCEECGASYTKTSEGQYLLHPTPGLEAIKQFFKHKIGYVPKELEKPKTAENAEEGITLLLTNDYKVVEIDEESGLINLQTTTNTNLKIPYFTFIFRILILKT